MDGSDRPDPEPILGPDSELRGLGCDPRWDSERSSGCPEGDSESGADSAWLEYQEEVVRPHLRGLWSELWWGPEEAEWPSPRGSEWSGGEEEEEGGVWDDARWSARHWRRLWWQAVRQYLRDTRGQTRWSTFDQGLTRGPGARTRASRVETARLFCPLRGRTRGRTRGPCPLRGGRMGGPTRVSRPREDRPGADGADSIDRTRISRGPESLRASSAGRGCREARRASIELGSLAGLPGEFDPARFGARGSETRRRASLGLPGGRTLANPA